MIGSIAQGYAARALMSIAGKVLQPSDTGEDRMNRNIPAASAAGTAAADTLTVSGKGKLLAANKLLLPTASNVQALSATLSQNISSLLTSAGIPPTSSFKIDVDGSTMDITVKGDGSGMAAIAKAIDGNEAIKNEIRTLAAISSHLAAAAEPSKSQGEYAANQDLGNLVLRYAALFGQQKANDISINFDGTAATVLVDGKNPVTGRS